MNILKDSAILSLQDFSRIKKSSYTPSLTTNTISKELINQENFTQKALEHKKKIMDYDRKKHEYNKILATEGTKIEEKYPGVEPDDEAIRAMDKICLYARISTVRDRQLKERKEMEKIYKKKEEKVDLMVEIERLKGMKEQEDKEKELQKIQKEGVKIILKQIEDNKRERQRQKDIEEKERKELLKRIEEEQQKEKELNIIKKIEQEKRVKESLEANEKAIQAKQQKILQEREEDLKIEKYNKEKYKKEEEEYQAKKRLEHEKEMELQKMREKQEKAQDFREIVDSIRAKRAFEETSRREREKEKEEMIMKEKKIRELINDNNMQKQSKLVKLAEEARKEKDEFERITKQHIIAMEKEKEKERNKLKKLLEHNADLKRQVVEKQEKEKVNKREVLEEGRKVKQKLDQYNRSIEAIRLEKIKQLRDMNIDEKYVVPLVKFNIKNLDKF